MNVIAGVTRGPMQTFESECDAAKGWIGAFQLRNGPIVAFDGTTKLQALQNSANNELDALSTKIAAEPDPVRQDTLKVEGMRQIWRIVGRYRELVDRLDRQPFSVGADLRDGCVVDLKIKTRDATIPIEAGKLKITIDGAVNVVTTVFGNRLKAKPWYRRPKTWRKQIFTAQSDYLQQLVGVAEVGLCTAEPSRTAFARLDLARVINIFKLREAGLIKNEYVRRLFVWTALAAAFFLALYVAARTRSLCPWIGQDACTVLYDTRNFCLLAVGTAIGTWLSFSLRRQNLSFSDLAVLEPDRLDPSARVLFMIGLASLVGLLLFTGAVIAGVGNVDGHAGTHTNGSYALLFGMLAGVAERALGTAVSARGREFAAAVGGGAPADMHAPAGTSQAG